MLAPSCCERAATIRIPSLYGFGGNDVLEGHGTGSYLDGGDGNDILTGGRACELVGGNGNDVLTGTIGSTSLYGGAGADILTRGDFTGAGVQHIFPKRSPTAA